MDNPQIDDCGDQFWYNEDGDLHRDDGPALIDTDGTEIWYQHGYEHREDGPSTIWANGDTEWWLNGYHYTFQSWLDVVDISDESKVMLKLEYG